MKYTKWNWGLGARFVVRKCGVYYMSYDCHLEMTDGILYDTREECQAECDNENRQAATRD